jgi:predicted metal-dependent peptidase
MASRKPKTSDEQLIEERMIRARSAIIMDSVFFGSLMVRLQPNANENISTMATEGRFIHYSPKFVESLSDSELKGVIVHEVLHCAMAHHARKGDREHMKWNAACDYAINPIVKESGFVLPDNCLESAAYANMSAEEIYPQLPEQEGGYDGDNPSWNVGNVDPGVPPSEADEEAQNWKNAVSEAAMTARMMGKLPANLERFVDDFLDAKLPWQELLARFVHNVAKNDFNWSRPNKGLLQNYGLYLPTLHNETCGSIALAIDTSGSIGETELSEFAAELNGILDMVRPEKVHVIYCDAQINAVEEFTPDQYPVRLQARGGGGTDFRPVFDHISEQIPDIQCAIYLTDMYGDFPEEAPDFPTMWVSNSSIKEAPFGQVVQLSK